MDAYPRPRRRRRLTRVRIAVLVGIVGATAVGAAAWGLLAPETVRVHQAWCYLEPALTSEHSITDVQDDTGSSDAARFALESCRATWAAGILSPTPGAADGSVHPVPPLVICQRSDGMLALFPDGQPGGEASLKTRADQEAFCHQLGLGAGPVPSPDTP